MPKSEARLRFPARLPDPESYYAGISHPLRPRSDNLIVFQRRCRESLQQQNFFNRSHHRHVLILNLETSGSVIIDGNELRLEPGLACYVRPFQFHHYLNLEAEALNWLFFTFDLEAGDDAMSRLCDLTFPTGRLGARGSGKTWPDWAAKHSTRASPTRPFAWARPPPASCF
jgi:Cupin domain.